jgi:hypothetical protein
VPRRSVCDFNASGKPFCQNGADEETCYRIWPLTTKIPTDEFGRFVSRPQGFLYIVLHGRQFLYCANTKIFKQELMQKVS